MTQVPAQISIYNLQINTFGLFLLLSFLFLAFAVWNEGKNDGFDEERLFDLLLVSIASGIIFSRVVHAFYNMTTATDFFNHIIKVWTPGYNTYGALVGAFLPIFLLCKRWKWSIYRILDIFSLGISLAASIIILGFVGLQAKFELLFAFSAFIFLFALLSKIRTSKLKSGYSFIVFLLISASLGLVFVGGRPYLPFYIVLVTLALVVFLFRWRIDRYESPRIVVRVAGGIKKAIRREKN